MEVGKYTVQQKPLIEVEIIDVTEEEVAFTCSGHELHLNRYSSEYTYIRISKRVEVFFQFDLPLEKPVVPPLKNDELVVKVHFDAELGDTYSSSKNSGDFEMAVEERTSFRPNHCHSYVGVDKIVSEEEIIIHVGRKQLTLKLDEPLSHSANDSQGYNDSFEWSSEKFVFELKRR